MINYTVELCERKELTDFIEKWHYSKSINGVRSTYCFKLLDGDEMIGAAIFGGMGMANTWKKFGENESDIIELRRLCCIDETEKNAESFFIGKCIRWLRNNTDIKVIVSYADPNYGHSGVIYKATNFEYHGVGADSRMIKHGDRYYHDKSIRTMYKGKLKPYAIRLREALESGEAYYLKRAGKHCYTLTIKRKPYKNSEYNE